MSQVLSLANSPMVLLWDLVKVHSGSSIFYGARLILYMMRLILYTHDVSSMLFL